MAVRLSVRLAVLSGQMSKQPNNKSREVCQLVITGYYHTPLPDKLSAEDRSLYKAILSLFYGRRIPTSFFPSVGGKK